MSALKIICSALALVLLWMVGGGLTRPLEDFFPDFNILETDFVLGGDSFECSGMPYEFQCNDESSSCIYVLYFCDTIIDCPNGFDENPFFCVNAWKNVCQLEREFQDTAARKPFELTSCRNEMCITECDVCDGEYLDCLDGSDEDPAICETDLRPPRIGDCSLYRQGRQP